MRNSSQMFFLTPAMTYIGFISKICRLWLVQDVTSNLTMNIIKAT